MDARAKVGHKQKFRQLVAAKKIKRGHKTGNAHQLAAKGRVGGRVAPHGLKFLQGLVCPGVVVVKPVKIEPVEDLGRIPRGRDKVFPGDFGILSALFGFSCLGQFLASGLPLLGFLPLVIVGKGQCRGTVPAAQQNRQQADDAPCNRGGDHADSLLCRSVEPIGQAYAVGPPCGNQACQKTRAIDCAP